MKSTWSLLFIFAFLTISSSVTAQTGEVVELQPKFIIGKTYRFDTSTTIQMKLPDLPNQNSSILLHQRVRLIVHRRPSGGEGVFITASTENIKFSLAADGSEMAFDSTDPAAMESPIGKHFKNSLSRWTQIEISDEGKFLARQDGGGPIDQAAPAEPDPLSHLPEIGPDELHQFVGSLMSNFPSEPVGKGQKWIHKSETSFGQFGAMIFEIANQYVDDELVDGAPCVHISYTGVVKGDVKVAGSDESGDKNTLGFNGTKMSGQFFFDPKLGLNRSSEQSMVMPVKNAQLPNATIEQQIQTQLVSVEDTAG